MFDSQEWSRTERKVFRRKHHYFTTLKYWQEYQSKFAYIDNKSQGLLAASGILIAVFLISLNYQFRTHHAVGSIELVKTLLAFLGFFCVVASSWALMRCFSTTAGQEFKQVQVSIGKFEDSLIAEESTKREAVIDWVLQEFKDLVEASPQDFEKCRSELEQKVTELVEASQSTSKPILLNFEEIRSELHDLIKELRARVENELDKRHRHYMTARYLVWAGIGLLGLHGVLMVWPAMQAVIGVT
ncbi:hypothetical protein [Shimia haliotis]|uniref:Uncharacterized protein n=1 Tax=Shimia haliotis TaxID=1280847 RepID=A0A1I4DQL8_9RHOB|nr:hypothetical protein [Shimia haliotis]SFK94261.1 hypothetical protein SAMN04488036_103270 [Shimia haliotis]